ncbi:MAG TPA: zf-HC2 domain-containing protein [candidate division Zixibacteria bacterium]|mgnify:CR=1 FL=1|nr:zf-HC2 domain-containing protein [candidate division Zixibacteria bacterium]
MRCRKVRSFLSAYCSDELDDRRKLKVSEHLLTCSGCRREEALYRQMAEATKQVKEIKVSDDFNARLLNRIAHERFAETRTKAYLPKPAPVFQWRRLAPVVATACLAVLLAVVYMPQAPNQPQSWALQESGLSDDYLTAQPDSNPNMTVYLDKGWSLDRQMAWARQVDRISSTVTPVSSYGGWDRHNRGMQTASSQNPYAPSFHKVRPIMKVYVAPQTNVKREGAGTY